MAAARVLALVLEKRLTLDESLDRVYAKMRLGDSDKRLVHAICGFAFRNLPRIDSILRRVMNRKKDPTPVLLHQILRVGVCQLLYMEIAPHAAVNTCVSAAGSLHLTHQKGLINAVLRSVQRQKDSLLKEEVDALDLLPEWLKTRWIKHYGESDTRSLIKAMGAQAPLDVSIKDADASLQWAQKLGGETLLKDSIRVHQGVGQITSWPGFEDGSWWIQDIASSIPIKLLGDISNKSVLDMCAAPGGKTLQAASAGAQVTALDISGSRMSRVTQNLRRLNLTDRVQTHVIDALTWRPGRRFDIVVLDAPCSSTGTLRRHPELPWIHEENDIAKMVMHQRDLLRCCTDLLGHDGILLYCTCSLEPEEGENQVEAFLAEHKNFKEIKDVPADLKSFVKEGVRGIGLRTFPTLLADRGGMDGFFIARLQRQ